MESAEAAKEDVCSEMNSVVQQTQLQSMRQALAEYEEKHGMDHPTTARMAWRLGLQLKGEDKEAMLMRAARALLECPGPAHEMTWTCFRDLYEHLDKAARADEDNAGIKHRLNNIRKQLLHTMAAGLLAGTSYWWTNVSWSSHYESGEFAELAEEMLGCRSGYSTTYQAEVLMDMIRGAERFLGADHIFSGCLLAQLHNLLQQFVEELTSMQAELQAQDVSSEDSVTSIPAQGNDEQLAHEKVEGDGADATDAESELEAEASATSAKYAMACKAASLGHDIAARQRSKLDTEKFQYWTKMEQDTPSKLDMYQLTTCSNFQKYLTIFGKPHVPQANVIRMAPSLPTSYTYAQDRNTATTLLPKCCWHVLVTYLLGLS